MLHELTLCAPLARRRISSLEIMQGPIIPAHQVVEVMPADEYELYTMEWVYGYLKSKYFKVRIFAGAGDKGRDVVGYDQDGKIDIYQCKHYDQKISPTTLYPELAKLVYYTYKKEYPVPEKYLMVAPKGCGPAVLDLIEKPMELRKKLIETWDTHCKDKISRGLSIELTGEFKDYLEAFDFSICGDVAPHELLEQHKQTTYHILRFGGGLKQFREIIPEPEPEIQNRELRYTSMLFDVYAQRLNSSINTIEVLRSASEHLFKHFGKQRNSFYSAESLEKFSRDNFPDAVPMPFDELKDEAENVLSTTLELNIEKSGYERLLIASQEIKRQGFTASPLAAEMKSIDKDGLCHHLANEQRIKWIDENGE
ncbi:ABC-three component system protein [Dyadobacter sp. LHD-138]|uniref:ABC-three component system protein n=1 Tax=Dyadobacter sp. LHD-138 TaxID=3071413 RepID=UPI0027E19CBC|nr:ABC-three component system protein [Dyadobacter sp. LHD-138]MDQ6481830.1 hypothetical protein [Dyadobacter sp. LHD-138]